ncbi:hypothetical protein JOY44_01010 [Phormidium sp. CLA17]|uniref:hypothetical protein n=1 Tax=Leptolyngbya sp. Cla-17 TaxID=2803751 RepID=UPI001845658E|nr:hypothetical protein [Leptolyngbya sp. Cla-17]MBM0740236.1 hypothetical protein [Leptolyngbya sp. Cla-17]
MPYRLTVDKLHGYSPVKPQLKIEISRAGTAEHIFRRGNPDSYEGISEHVGVFPCLPEDQQNVPMQHRRSLSAVAPVTTKLSGFTSITTAAKSDPV